MHVDQKARKKDALHGLHIVLQDEYGKTFNQMLPLDLYFFYNKMREMRSMLSQTVWMQICHARRVGASRIDTPRHYLD